MNNSLHNFPIPSNEPILEYLEGSQEREELEKELKRQSEIVVEIPLVIGGKEIFTNDTGKVVMPHNHKHILANFHKAGEKEIKMAIDAAIDSHKIWSDLNWTTRASIMLKIADLLTVKYRALINAATMLGQSKNIYQSEIDAVCETADFLRFNVYFASEIYKTQPISSFNQLNRMEYRALEGFVFSVSPFNFTSIASNLNLSPVMMGNTTVWKPATTALLSNYYLMKIFLEAGVPPGVVNFVPGSGALIGKEVLKSPHLAGIHFTGSNSTFNSLWRQVGERLTNYRSYPRVVGETGGKDFIFVHPSANVTEVAVAAYSGAFEYQGQKCSAASRAYIPQSLWEEFKKEIVKISESAKMGDVAESDNFVNAVIDKASFDNIASYIKKAQSSNEAEIIFGGEYDDSIGFFVKPTLILTTNPHFLTMEEEIFGPVLTAYVYEDEQIEQTLDICDTTSPYGLTGAVFGQDRVAVASICNRLRYAAGNFYINDKPTGAVVGKQPFGGSRGSGTNDKAGGVFNLIRWVSPRTVKETFIPPVDIRYGYMKKRSSKN
ncbi:MAG: 1-pyrroline-5-carboxylate dehydrogenase [Bacteroidetes bacterium GWE2_39_28]|nr:MAG: 1-pyrroline-5-carboxylate dehydrogenase [Bacteroidetes bacterium GWE2_39_28]OFY15288.1 MAG: 1-pyrroline-5-carboxylate dehydrogenase [Bacteroidetes bacterium GWF2_39_10]OFZ07687.1 MAG: 1-pyrroline-5-carboxylate dehydrogenase [Bacteroidetes bacterium RIFOXYB2_FULL_39_7]OFZ11136.1 MAG: 1-pyrroline-5-carboxylate dehydrogenase [Bacteroidetes bacterium RIFOXYC2_FULL_39_11]HCT93922.1 1-pyrroline-5-carboxylate dehydrogenase [Rikenellaceae bacterium]